MIISAFFDTQTYTCDSGPAQKALDVAQDCKKNVIIYGYPYSVHTNAWIHASAFLNKDADAVELLLLECDGAFSMCIVDPIEKLVKIYTDRYRLFCLYYLRTETSIHISDNLSALQAYSQCILDPSALYALYCMNCTIGTQTLWQDVHTFEEGKRIEISANGAMRMNTVHTFPEPDAPADEKDIYTAFDAHLQRCMQQGNTVSLAITAGLDSRVILAAMSGYDRDRLHTYTHGVPGAMDVRMGKQLAKALGAEHTFYNLRDSSTFRASIPQWEMEVNSRYEGMLNAISHAHAAHVYTQQAKKADTFFSAFGGELFRSYYLPDNWKRDMSLDALAEGIRKLSIVQVDYSVFKHTEKEISEMLNHSIYTELKKAVSDNPVYLADWYYHRRNFNSVTTRFAGSYFRLCTPYFSDALYALAVRIPVAWKKEGRVHKMLIERFAPQLSAFLVNGKPFYSDSRFAEIRKNIAVNKARLRRVINAIAGSEVFPTYFTDYGHWIRTGHLEYYLSVASYTGAPDTVLDANKWEEHFRKTFSVNKSFNEIKFTTNVLSTLSFMRSM